MVLDLDNKQIVFFLSIFCSLCTVRGQVVGQDAEGFSTIIVPTSTISLDVTNNIATFDFYTDNWSDEDSLTDLLTHNDCLKRVDKITDENQEAQLKMLTKCVDSIEQVNQTRYNTDSKSNYESWGFNLKGTTKEGFGTLFSNEKVSPTVSISALRGWNRNRRYYDSSTSKLLAESYLKRKRLNLIIKDKTVLIKKELSKYENLGLLTTESRAYYNDFTKLNGSEQANRITSIMKDIEEKLGSTKDDVLDVKLVESNISQKDSLKNNLQNIQSLIQRLDTHKNQGKPLDTISKAKKDIEDAYEFLLSAKFKNPNEKFYKNDYSYDELFSKKIWDSNLTKINSIIENLNYVLYSIKVGSKSYSLSLLEAYKTLKKSTESLKKTEKNISEIRDSKIQNRNEFYYGRIGVSGSDFKYDYGVDSTTTSSRFQRRLFQGYKIEAGMVKHFKKVHFIGLNATINFTNNLSDLVSTTYNLQSKDTTITNGSFSTSEEITALSGNFDTFLRYDLNFDYAYLVPLSNNSAMLGDAGESKLYLSLNPYLRHRIYDNAQSLKNNTILGFGVHAFSTKDNKIMGGLFVQTQDLFGVHADDKSVLLNRINFGIIVKAGFKGFNPTAKK